VATNILFKFREFLKHAIIHAAFGHVTPKLQNSIHFAYLGLRSKRLEHRLEVNENIRRSLLGPVLDRTFEFLYCSGRSPGCWSPQPLPDDPNKDVGGGNLRIDDGLGIRINAGDAVFPADRAEANSPMDSDRLIEFSADIPHDLALGRQL
jgi:hypothetical protein